MKFKINDLNKMQDLAEKEPNKVLEYLEMLPKKLRVEMYTKYCTKDQIIELLKAWLYNYEMKGQRSYKRLYNMLLKANEKKHSLDMYKYIE